MLEGGVYGILGSGGITSEDADFARVYAQARALKRKNGTPSPPPLMSVNVAVLDSGVVSKDDAYFGDRVGGSFDAQGGVGIKMTKGLPATEGQHGAHVASIASSGTTMVKIIDIQIAKTQEGGKVLSSVWTNAFKWAIQQGARIVNVSVVCPWSDAAIKSIVESNTGTLFLATSGNGNIEFTAAERRSMGFEKGNVMLVSGCNREGGRENNRGFGAGIDIYVPSVQVPGILAKRFAQELFHARDLKEWIRQNAKLDPDRQTVASLKDKLAAGNDDKLAGRLKREEARLAAGLKNLPTHPGNVDTFPINEAALKVADDGVSFGIPMVANVAAKMILIYPNITPVQISTAIKSSAQSLGAGPVLDPRAAYNAALKLREEWVARI